MKLNGSQKKNITKKSKKKPKKEQNKKTSQIPTNQPANQQNNTPVKSKHLKWFITTDTRV